MQKTIIYAQVAPDGILGKNWNRWRKCFLFTGSNSKIVGSKVMWVDIISLEHIRNMILIGLSLHHCQVMASQIFCSRITAMLKPVSLVGIWRGGQHR
jgi:hypothetical protein